MPAHEYSWHDVVFLAESSDGCRAANTGKNQQRGGFAGKARKAADARRGTGEEAETKNAAKQLECPLFILLAN